MNNQFAALLIKYVSAKKISNSKTVQAFIKEHTPSEYNGYPEKRTPEINQFCVDFVSKDLKSKDPEFSKFVVNNAVATEVASFVPTKTSFQKGEY